MSPSAWQSNKALLFYFTQNSCLRDSIWHLCTEAKLSASSSNARELHQAHWMLAGAEVAIEGQHPPPGGHTYTKSIPTLPLRFRKRPPCALGECQELGL